MSRSVCSSVPPAIPLPSTFLSSTNKSTDFSEPRRPCHDCVSRGRRRRGSGTMISFINLDQLPAGPALERRGELPFSEQRNHVVHTERPRQSEQLPVAHSDRTTIDAGARAHVMLQIRESLLEVDKTYH